jgi:hypothetical protein
MGWLGRMGRGFSSGVSGIGDSFSNGLSAAGGGISGAGDWIGGGWNDITGKSAARDAARAQMGAAQTASNTQMQMFNQNQQNLQPYMDAGAANVGRLGDLVNSGDYAASYGGPSYTDPGFHFSGADVTSDPGYQFRMDQANKALSRSAAARGGALGGGQLRALTDLNSNLASQEYGNAYARNRGSYQADRAFGYGQSMDQRNEFYQNQGNRFNRLSGLVDRGQQAATGLAGMRTGLGRDLADNTMQGANAYAAGRVGGYNSQRDTIMGALGAGSKIAGML